LTVIFGGKLVPGHLPPSPAGSYWLVSRGLVAPGGQASSSVAHGGAGGPTQGISINGVPITNMPSACQALVFQNPLKTMSCLTAHGYRGLITYQPASRYWAFQGIETGIFVILAAILIAMTAIVVLRRDA
jgi:hypothetical protein